MFQSFENASEGHHAVTRVAALRRAMKMNAIDGFIVPRADQHQGEYVAPCDARLSWLTGFSGSAGFAIILDQSAGIFIDGRYRTQVKKEADLSIFTPVPWPEVDAGSWLTEQLTDTIAIIGFDPWLHTQSDIKSIEKKLADSNISLVPVDNLVDTIWHDRPPAPSSNIKIQPIELSGRSSADKRAETADLLLTEGQKSCVLSQCDSIAWLLNIRGNDIPHTPIVQGFAIIEDDGHTQFFTALGRDIPAEINQDVTLRPLSDFAKSLKSVQGPVRIDPDSVPIAVHQILAQENIEVNDAIDPITLPKAQKNPTEIKGAVEAHLRDGAAVVEFMTWFENAKTTALSEIDLVTKLEENRRNTNALLDISFDTIAGSGPNGAIIHYRVSHDTNRQLHPGDLVVLDSGGQYQDATTDITRVLSLGDIDEEKKRCYTRVLQGVIALSRCYFPEGKTGRDLDPLARYPLWAAHQDFNHGTGHGVGSYLSVHEGPQRFSSTSNIKLLPGMILSVEPGYYRENDFGIRLENLVVVEPAICPPGGDNFRNMLCLKTLTYVPFDRALIIAEMLSSDEKNWLNQYHRDCFNQLHSRLTPGAQAWLTDATKPV